jgi:hypothetical protein
MYYGATGSEEVVRPDDTAVRWPWDRVPSRGADPFDDDIEEPSDEPWSVASKRRRGGIRNGPAERMAVASDGHTSRRRARVELVLYTSAASGKCQKALRAVMKVLRDYDPAQVSLTVRDLSGDPAAGDEDAVIFTPTLVKRGPGPRTYLVGDLDQPHLLMDLLDVSGVKRISNR